MLFRSQFKKIFTPAGGKNPVPYVFSQLFLSPEVIRIFKSKYCILHARFSAFPRCIQKACLPSRCFVVKRRGKQLKIHASGGFIHLPTKYTLAKKGFHTHMHFFTPGNLWDMNMIYGHYFQCGCFPFNSKGIFFCSLLHKFTVSCAQKSATPSKRKCAVHPHHCVRRLLCFLIPQDCPFPGVCLWG